VASCSVAILVIGEPFLEHVRERETPAKAAGGESLPLQGVAEATELAARGYVRSNIEPDGFEPVDELRHGRRAVERCGDGIADLFRERLAAAFRNRDFRDGRRAPMFCRTRGVDKVRAPHLLKAEGLLDRADRLLGPAPIVGVRDYAAVAAQPAGDDMHVIAMRHGRPMLDPH
jgi:hypothetical protein